MDNMYWSDVHDELPKVDLPCLVFIDGEGDNKCVEPAHYCKKSKKFYRYNNNAPDDKCRVYFYAGVTHWMEFPDFPEFS